MARPAQRILGLDPSLRGTGMAVIELSGERVTVIAWTTVRNPAPWPHSRCLRRLFETLGEQISAHRPNAAAVESPFFGRNARTAMALGEARGAILAACATRDLPVYEYAPRQVKLAVAGRGSATKEQVQHMMRVLTGFQEEASEDEIDAMAVALCHAHRARPAGRNEARPL